MNRRDLLKAAAALPALSIAGRLYAAPITDAPRLLVVFMRGAYDAANIFVPVSSDFYHEARPTIAIAKNATLPLDNDWGLHPALKDSIYPLWQKKQVAFIPFAGTDDLTRSHFETQDTIELGQPVSGNRNYRSGFMGRIIKALSGSYPIAFTGQVPLTFRGAAAVPNITLTNTGKPGVAGKDAELIQAMYQGLELAPNVSEGFRVQNEVYEVISAEMKSANRDAVSAKGFELAAQRIGILMREKFNVGFVDVGGWDTHVNEGGVDGYLPSRIGELGRGLATLAEQLGPQWDNTIVVVVSEFGRTFRENGNRGTDHGHGSVYWVLGGGVRGGRMAGEQVAVTRATLFQDRDYPVLNDYRPLISGLLNKSYGLSADQLGQIFPGIQASDLSLV